MSKMEEMAVEFAATKYSPEKTKFLTAETRGMLQVACASGHVQGWKDCLKHDERVKELVEALEHIAKRDIACSPCNRNTDEGIIEHQREVCRKALSKFREKVGE